MKVNEWNKDNLEGTWVITKKIDGIRCERVEDGWVSKAGKGTLFGLDNHNGRTKHGEIYEYFTGNWNDSAHIMASDNIVNFNNLYSLYPDIDDRLFIGSIENPTTEQITELMNKYVKEGYEGLVLRKDDQFIKVKPTVTYDVEVLDLYEGKGKNKNKMGGAQTCMGGVGGGWTDKEREEYWLEPDKLIGKIIEVKCQCLTKNGKFRFGSFVRIRNDKR